LGGSVVGVGTCTVSAVTAGTTISAVGTIAVGTAVSGVGLVADEVNFGLGWFGWGLGGDDDLWAVGVILLLEEDVDEGLLFWGGGDEIVEIDSFSWGLGRSLDE
jgi:hypothetical protein